MGSLRAKSVDGSRPPEASRDQDESAFTPILRALWRSSEAVLAAAFVDLEGECIDYVSSLDPYEAKVNAAHMLVLMDAIASARARSTTGIPVLLQISGDRRELWARRVSEEYLLVVVLLPGFDRGRTVTELKAAAAAFRDEVGLARPPWDDAAAHAIEVEVRAAVGWPYAPVSITEAGAKTGIADVLGHWTEPGEPGEDELVCFLVRTEDGQEMTLVHDRGGGAWIARY